MGRRESADVVLVVCGCVCACIASSVASSSLEEGPQHGGDRCSSGMNLLSAMSKVSAVSLTPDGLGHAVSIQGLALSIS